MTEEQYNNAPELDKILYDCTGMLVKNHNGIVDAMKKYAVYEVGIKPIKETTNEELFRKDLERIGLLNVTVKEGENYMLNVSFDVNNIEFKIQCCDEYKIKNSLLVMYKNAFNDLDTRSIQFLK